MMKKGNIFAVLLLSVVILLSGCNVSSYTKETAAGAGALFNGGKGSIRGAGTGVVIGGTAGVLIGNKMGKQKAELERIQGAQVESVNGGEAIKVTFESGILFATNSSSLNRISKNVLTSFAKSLNTNSDTDVRIYGHTDSSGNDQINIPLSQQRAQSVMDYLVVQGIGASRIFSQGMGASQPIANNSTSIGKAQNRRLEIYITPNTKMIQEAKKGTLK